MGFVLPPVRIQDNVQLGADTYSIRIKEIEAGRGELRPTQLLVMDPNGGIPPFPGERTIEPTFGLPALCGSSPARRDEAMARGCTVVDPPSVLTTHITEVVRDSMAELLSYAETQKLLDELPREQQKLVVRPHPLADQRRRCAACVAGATGRTCVDPRSSDRVGGHCRGLWRPFAPGGHDRGPCSWPPGPADQRQPYGARPATSPW